MGKRNFFAALNVERCVWDVVLRDGSKAQCMRRSTLGRLCAQHAKMAAAWNCEYCGGNDHFPQEHTVDCGRPA